MTRQEFDAQLDQHYGQLVRMAQIRLNRRGLKGIQGEDIVNKIVCHILEDPARLERLGGMGYFQKAIAHAVLDQAKTGKNSLARNTEYWKSVTPQNRHRNDRRLTSRKPNAE